MTTEELIENQPTSGAKLKQLREAKDLSIQDVATQLRLDLQVIEALEENNYDRFPADTYIRGYLRSYAKLVGADGDEIISLYKSEAPGPPEIIPDVKHPTQVSSSDKPVKAFTYLVTLILVLLLFIWWQQSNVIISGSTQVTTAPEYVVTDPQFEQLDTVSDITLETFEPEPFDGEESENLSDSKLTLEPAESIESMRIDDGTDTNTESESVQTAYLTTDNKPDTDDTEVMVGPDTIYLKLNADCWIEIHDQFNNEVYRDLARTGVEILLRGYAPFQVKLGNAQGVIVEFNNEPFDPAPFTTKGIARFTLGD